MVSFNLVLDNSPYLFTYMFVYNLSLTLLFWSLFSTILTEFKSLYSFSNLSFNSFIVLAVTVLLLSMAGVPPFIGFFSKLFIITMLLGSSFFLFYAIFLVLLLIGLYFYVQNIRFLHSTNHQTTNQPFVMGGERVVVSFYYITVFSMVVLGLGTFYVDDILLFFTWLCM